MVTLTLLLSRISVGSTVPLSVQSPTHFSPWVTLRWTYHTNYGRHNYKPAVLGRGTRIGRPQPTDRDIMLHHMLHTCVRVRIVKYQVLRIYEHVSTCRLIRENEFPSVYGGTAVPYSVSSPRALNFTAVLSLQKYFVYYCTAVRG